MGMPPRYPPLPCYPPPLSDLSKISLYAPVRAHSKRPSGSFPEASVCPASANCACMGLPKTRLPSALPAADTRIFDNVQHKLRLRRENERIALQNRPDRSARAKKPFACTEVLSHACCKLRPAPVQLCLRAGLRCGVCRALRLRRRRCKPCQWVVRIVRERRSIVIFRFRLRLLLLPLHARVKIAGSKARLQLGNSCAERRKVDFNAGSQKLYQTQLRCHTAHRHFFPTAPFAACTRDKSRSSSPGSSIVQLHCLRLVRDARKASRCHFWAPP